MWLLNTRTLELESFEGPKPKYAILSHRWEKDEVSFDDIQNARGREKRGYKKIRNCCQQAFQGDLDYAWIDTCCIDKRSSAELSEAINSMFRWYKDAEVCYAYLSDVSSCDVDGDEFAKSLWFTRGWTLQELLAPRILIFYDKTWRAIGSKRERSIEINQITNIATEALINFERDESCVAVKMSWAAGRNTTREEDRAYSLLGLFEVNMPLLYGEGEKAFLRLQEEIIKSSTDSSIFAWSCHPHPSFSMFAQSPDSFEPDPRFGELEPFDMEASVSGTALNIYILRYQHVFNIYFAWLGISVTTETPQETICAVGIFLEFDFNEDCYRRVSLDDNMLGRMNTSIGSFPVPYSTMKITKETCLSNRSSVILPHDLSFQSWGWRLNYIILKDGKMYSAEEDYFDAENTSIVPKAGQANMRRLEKSFTDRHPSMVEHINSRLELQQSDCVAIISERSCKVIHFGKTMDGQYTVLLSKVQTGSDRRHRQKHVDSHGCCDTSCADWRFEWPVAHVRGTRPASSPMINSRTFIIDGLCTVLIEQNAGYCFTARISLNESTLLNEYLPSTWFTTPEDSENLSKPSDPLTQEWKYDAQIDRQQVDGNESIDEL